MQPFMDIRSLTPHLGRVKCVWVPRRDGRLESVWVPDWEQDPNGEIAPVRQAS